MMAQFNSVKKFYFNCQEKLLKPWKQAGEITKVSIK